MEETVATVAEEAASMFNWQLLAGTALCYFGGSLCAGTGIGGGAFYIPVFVLILQMDPHLAIPLSKVTIFGISIGGYLVNWRKRHPEADRPLIAYDVAMVMEPMTLAGTIIGVYLNVTFPAYLIIVFLVLLLAFSSYKTVKKGLKTFRLERAAEAAEKEGEDAVELLEVAEERSYEDHFQIEDDEDMYSLDADAEDDLGDLKPPTAPAVTAEDAPAGDDVPLEMADGDDVELEETEEQRQQRLQFLKADSRIPLHKIGLLVALWVGMFVLILLKGGTSEDSSVVPGLECGSLWYWLLVVLEFPYLIGFAIAYGVYLRWDYQRRVACNYPFVKGDIAWDLKNSIMMPVLSTIAGVAAGFLGIGGGMVKGPLMLSMNMIPQVSVVTSAFMIMFTSSSTTAQFVILGKLPLGYAVWYFVVGVLAAITGNMGVSYMVKKYQIGRAHV